ncbi:MAG TPA: hypothetical protein VMW10_06330 [Alphaproteobacteria bacterium]|nr:hypothetical protein [Alphaproteobacteria bacterium]
MFRLTSSFKYILFFLFVLNSSLTQAVYLLKVEDGVELQEEDKQAIHTVYKKFAFPSGTKFRDKPHKYSKVLENYAKEEAPETAFIQDKIYKACPHLKGRVQVFEVPTFLWELHAISKILTDCEFGTSFFAKRNENQTQCYNATYFDLNKGLVQYLEKYDGNFWNDCKEILLGLLDPIVKLSKEDNSDKAFSNYIDIFQSNQSTQRQDSSSSNFFDWIQPLVSEHSCLTENGVSTFARMWDIEQESIQKNRGLIVRGTRGWALPFNQDQYYIDLESIPSKTERPFLDAVTAISYGYSFLSGYLFDSFNMERSACPYIFMKHRAWYNNPDSVSRVGYALELNKQWFYEYGVRLFYFPRVNDWEGIFNQGEHFHPRSLRVWASHFSSSSSVSREHQSKDIGATYGHNFNLDVEVTQQLPLQNLLNSTFSPEQNAKEMVTSYFLLFAKFIAENSKIVTMRGQVISSNEDPRAKYCLLNQRLIFDHYYYGRRPEFYSSCYFDIALKQVDPADYYEKGNQYKDSKKELQKAEEFYKLAAAQGHEKAREKLSTIYFGRGANFEDEAQMALAFKWYKNAAKLGHKFAIRQLLDLYRGKIEGLENQKNPEKENYWKIQLAKNKSM